jgi:hypothetical protein
MVEQWSSKSHTWVRFLLPLLLHTRHKYRKNYKSRVYQRPHITNFFFKSNRQVVKKFSQLTKNSSYNFFIFKKNSVKATICDYPRRSGANSLTWLHHLISLLSELWIAPNIRKYRYAPFNSYPLISYNLLKTKINIVFLQNFTQFRKILKLNYYRASHLSADLNNYIYTYANNFMLNIDNKIALTRAIKKTNNKDNFIRFFFRNRMALEPLGPCANFLQSAKALRLHRAGAFILRPKIYNLWFDYKIKKKYSNAALTDLGSFNKLEVYDSEPLKPFLSSFRSYYDVARVIYRNFLFNMLRLRKYEISTFLVEDYDMYHQSIIRITKNNRNWEISEYLPIENFNKPIKIFTDSIRPFWLSVVSTSAPIKERYLETYFSNNLLENYFIEHDADNLELVPLATKSMPSRSLIAYFSNALSQLGMSLALRNFSTDRLTLDYELNIKTSDYLNQPTIRELCCFLNSNNDLSQSNANTFIFQKFENLCNFFNNPLFFKFFVIKYSLSIITYVKTTLYALLSTLGSYFFYNKCRKQHSNLIPNISFFFFIKKYIMKVFSYQKFNIITTPWYFNTLVRFIEHCSGKRAQVRFFMFLNNSLTFVEKARCLMWSQKVKNFRRLLGPRLFLNESMQILYIALKNKDPFFLANWMTAMFQKISFWKYKVFLRYLKYILRYFFWAVFRELNLRGVKMQLKGKISVAGNARTRTVLHRIGRTSHATFDNKVVNTLTLVRTFTGVQGLKVWLFF